MGISRQAYYKRNRADATRLALDQKVADFVQQKRQRQPRLGTRKLHHLLHCQPQLELQVGRYRLISTLHERRLLVACKRAYHKTTDSDHRLRRHLNLLKPGPDQVVPTGPEQVWVADITYQPTWDGVAYLSLVTDASSRKIVGYHGHESLHTESLVQALRRAVSQRQTTQPLVHHSDRGSQYCSGMYQELHAKHGIRCSMTDGYDCYQNALADRVNGILKTELMLERPHDLTQAKKMVSELISIYNGGCPYQSLKHKTPDVMHRALG